VSTSSEAIRPCVNCEGGVTRRSFLTASVLTAVMAALDGCAMSPTAADARWTGAYGGPITVNLANYTALGSTGGVARVDNGKGAPTALYRSGTTSFVAVALVCTHAGYYPVEVTSSGFYCPLHGSSFSKSGAVTGGVATAAMQTFTTSFEPVTGVVTINRPA
jgi:cytochrome b6-f complex iron-sulfur subunit